MRRGSAPPGDSATRITGIALGPIFFAPRRGIVCMWTEISYIWHPDATPNKQNARGTAGDNRFNCNRILRAAVYDVPPAPPGDSAGQKIALIATGLYCNPFITMSLAFREIHSVHSANAFLNDQYCESTPKSKLLCLCWVPFELFLFIMFLRFDFLKPFTDIQTAINPISVISNTVLCAQLSA